MSYNTLKEDNFLVILFLTFSIQHFVYFVMFKFYVLVRVNVDIKFFSDSGDKIILTLCTIEVIF